MAITRLSGGTTPADGADPRTFPAIWNGTADDLEAGDYSKVPTGGTAGQVLVKQSVTDFDTGWENGDPAPITGISGRWVSLFGGIGTLAGTAGRSVSVPLWIGRTVSVDRIAGVCTTAGAAGSVVRLGIYKFDNQGGDLTLVIDAGTIDGTLTTVQTITISVSLTRGLYLPVAFAQGAPATEPVFRTKGSANFGTANATAVSNLITTTSAFLIDGITGALPSTVAYPIASLGAGYFVPLRLA